MTEKRKKIFCPSMMCADFLKVQCEVKELEKANVDIFHMDVMDGSYVPNMALGAADFKAVRKLSSTLMDVHLMVENPDNVIELFSDLGADIIYFHPDTATIPSATAKKIQDLDKRVGIAINPDISYSQVEQLLYLADYVLIMTVNPGFAGQKYLDFVNNKIQDFAEVKNKFNFTLVVDGAISKQMVYELSDLGVDGFVLGTSALFNKNENYQDLISQLK